MKRLFNILLCAALSLTLFACNDNVVEVNPDNSGTKPTDKGPVIGTYKFNGEERPLRSAIAQRGSYLYQFVFTEDPLEYNEETGRYRYNGDVIIEFQLVASMVNLQLDASRLYHNDQYWFYYDTPTYYFSPYYGGNFRSGDVFVDDFGDTMHVYLDVELANGMNFFLDYQGEFIEERVSYDE